MPLFTLVFVYFEKNTQITNRYNNNQPTLVAYINVAKKKMHTARNKLKVTIHNVEMNNAVLRANWVIFAHVGLGIDDYGA